MAPRAGRDHLDHDAVGLAPADGRGDPVVVAAVEADGDAQDGREDPHQVLVVGVEAGELAVAGLRRALAVVPGEEGDDLDLVVGQPGEDLAVADHVVRVQVVAAVGDEEADVGQQRARLEVLAGRLPEALQRRARPAGRPDRRTARGPGGRRGRSARARRRTARPGAPRSAVTRPAGGGASRRGSAGSCRAAPPRGGRSPSTPAPRRRTSRTRPRGSALRPARCRPGWRRARGGGCAA